MQPRSKWAVAAFAATMLAVSTAGATMVRTGRMAPHPDGGLRCTVVNLAMKPIDFRIELRDVAGRVVTNYVLFEWADDVVVARVVAESYADTPAYCLVRVRGGWRRDVDAILESFDADGNIVGRLGPKP
jgi:hypothetical protein